MKIFKKTKWLAFLQMSLIISLVIINIFTFRNNRIMKERMDLIENFQIKRHPMVINWKPGVIVYHLAPLDTIPYQPFSILRIHTPDGNPNDIKTSTGCVIIHDKFNKDLQNGYFEIGLNMGAVRTNSTEYIQVKYGDGSAQKYFVRALSKTKMNTARRKEVVYEIGNI